MRYCLNYSGTRFLSTEMIKITQFPNGFRLNSHGARAPDINSLPSVKTRLVGVSETTPTASKQQICTHNQQS